MGSNCQGSRTPGRGFGSFCLAFTMQVSSQEAVALLAQLLGPSMGQMQGGRVWGYRPWESQTLK